MKFWLMTLAVLGFSFLVASDADARHGRRHHRRGGCGCSSYDSGYYNGGYGYQGGYGGYATGYQSGGYVEGNVNVSDPNVRVNVPGSVRTDVRANVPGARTDIRANVNDGVRGDVRANVNGDVRGDVRANVPRGAEVEARAVNQDEIPAVPGSRD